MQKMKFLGAVLAVCLLFSSCAGGKSESDVFDPKSDILATLFHQPYLDAAEINVHYSRERKAMPKKIAAALEEEPVIVKVEDGGLFDADYYAVTTNRSGLHYYGKVKNNRPDGFGVLTYNEVTLSQPDTLQQLVYAGDFTKGRFDGYGAKFSNSNYGNSTYANSVVESENLDSSYYPLVCAYLQAYVVFDGKWKNGEMNGEGNMFSAIGGISAPAQAGYWGGACYPSVIYVTNVKDSWITGDTKQYSNGCLIYDGEMKYSGRHGDGVSYFYNGQKQYDGHWKENQYDGSGKLYDENGTLVYSGKWKNGDYAS